MTDVLVLTLIFIYSAWIIMQRYREYRFASRLHRCFGCSCCSACEKGAGQVLTEGRGRKN